MAQPTRDLKESINDLVEGILAKRKPATGQQNQWSLAEFAYLLETAFSVRFTGEDFSNSDLKYVGNRLSNSGLVGLWKRVNELLLEKSPEE